ncbi:5-oxoprolinase subunit PxpA [Bacillus sp. FJAT-49736]|uniref:5-oxoprolinase subunit PxpA n=1 Tax=Bacillus sp. FJAT-49736 TaxID=2833582 RepID=UPI001BC9E65A|nr:5-oxoprolinase subunit PxpA [Bacillus sp. FJAT-49736]MBS4174337.1 LamB/YcsF family protein [Bacillus sp. FJAT-49736]
MRKIDLNCDLGESFGRYTVGNDKEIMKYITSANIACGMHAGDPDIMNETVQLAMKHGVKLGAHPGYPDLQGFGRRNMNLSAKETYNLIIYQIGALDAFVKMHGGVLHHVKPHGALYNMAAVDPQLAEAIAKSVYDYNPALNLYGLSGSELTKAGERVGLKVAHEVFADRTYQSNGTLTPRNQPNALIQNDQDSINQVLKMVKEGKVTTADGREITIQADTICIHGDGPHSLTFAKLVSQVLSSC